MVEYIEREAVNALIEAECSPKVAAFLNHAIDNIPAADVRPVVRGKWIMNDECRTVCSLCGNTVAFVSHPDRRWDLGNYCPNCGAMMEGS